MKFNFTINKKQTALHCPACGESNFARRDDSFKEWVRCMNCGLEIQAEREYGHNPRLVLAWEDQLHEKFVLQRPVKELPIRKVT